jgi:hypothetical protein
VPWLVASRRSPLTTPALTRIERVTASASASEDGSSMAAGVGLEDLQSALVGDEAVLDHLRQPAAQIVDGQRREQVQVGEHGGRFPEGAHQVLPRVQVDARLPSHRSVHHRQQGGGHGDVAHPAQPGRRDEAGQVGRRAPTEPHHRIAAGEPGARQCVPAVSEETGRLRSFPRRRAQQEDLGVDGLGQRLRPVGEFDRVQERDAGAVVHQRGKQRGAPWPTVTS